MKCLIPLLISLYKYLAEVKEADLTPIKQIRAVFPCLLLKMTFTDFFLCSIQLYAAML